MTTMLAARPFGAIWPYPPGALRIVVHDVNIEAWDADPPEVSRYGLQNFGSKRSGGVVVQLEMLHLSPV